MKKMSEGMRYYLITLSVCFLLFILHLAQHINIFGAIYYFYHRTYKPGAYELIYPIDLNTTNKISISIVPKKNSDYYLMLVLKQNSREEINRVFSYKRDVDILMKKLYGESEFHKWDKGNFPLNYLSSIPDDYLKNISYVTVKVMNEGDELLSESKEFIYLFLAPNEMRHRLTRNYFKKGHTYNIEIEFHNLEYFPLKDIKASFAFGYGYHLAK